jgi:hypothetical protein
VSSQLHTPAALPLGKKPPVPIGLGGPQSRSERRGEEKIIAPTWTQNSDPSVIQPVASCYTDYAILALKLGGGGGKQ